MTNAMVDREKRLGLVGYTWPRPWGQAQDELELDVSQQRREEESQSHQQQQLLLRRKFLALKSLTEKAEKLADEAPSSDSQQRRKDQCHRSPEQMPLGLRTQTLERELDQQPVVDTQTRT